MAAIKRREDPWLRGVEIDALDSLGAGEELPLSKEQRLVDVLQAVHRNPRQQFYGLPQPATHLHIQSHLCRSGAHRSIKTGVSS